MRSKKSIPMQSRVLGIDPGYGRLGIAIIEKQSNKEVLLHSECFETSDKLPHPARLGLVAKRLEEIIKEFEPSKMSIETLLFSKNVKTAIKVAEARGVILALAAQKNIRIREFNPNTVKLAVTGSGRADKKQMINMIQKLLNIKHRIKHDDEYDAIALALTLSATREELF